VSREPIPLRDALQKVADALGMPPADTTTRVDEALRAVVGDDVAAHARVRSLRDGTCIVEVDGPAWATRVRYVTERFRRAANDACGHAVVNTVNVVVGAPRKAL
jgi:predicted nucleic acid-binding Zn ribbon protein